MLQRFAPRILVTSTWLWRVGLAEWRPLATACVLVILSALLRLPVPFISIRLIDVVIPARRGAELATLTALIIALTGVFIATESIKSYVLMRTSRKVSATIEAHVMRHVLGLRLSYLNGRDHGYIMSRLVNDLGQLSTLVTDTALSVVQQTAILLCGVFAVFQIHTGLASASLSLLPLVVFVSARFGPQLRDRSRRVQEKKALVMESISESLAGIIVTRACGRERAQVRKVFGRRADAIREEMGSFAVSVRANGINALLATAAPLVVLCYGAAEIMHGRLTVGALIGFNSVLAYLHGPAQSLSSLYLGMQSGIAALDRISELLALPTEQAQGDGSAPTLPNAAGVLRVRDVRFGYEAADPILRGVSFEVAPGRPVAIVGESGSGKTSLIQLLLRFYEPQSGSIVLDGADIRSYDLADLRRRVAVVSTDAGLFNGSVLDNVRFGRVGCSEDQARRAARLAGVDEFIDSLPLGYATSVGRQGFQLSAGQRQRIALARALTRNPCVVVFDEATSSVDSRSEEAIWSRVRALLRDRSLIVISHRLSTLADIDVVYHLHAGTLSRIGTPADMLANPDIRQLYGRQLAAVAVPQE